MRRVFVSLLVLAGAGCQQSNSGKVLGDGHAATETRQIEGVRGIVFRGGGSLEIKIGTPGPLELSGDGNILPLIDTRVEQGTLKIEPVKSIQPRNKLTFRLTVADLESLSIDGAANFHIAPLDNDALTIKLRGAADGIVVGQTGSLDVELEGASQLDAAALVAKTARIVINGASTAKLHVEEALDVTINGVGKVIYTGDPKVKRVIRGLGTVKKAP